MSSLLPAYSDSGQQLEYLVELWSGDSGSTLKGAIFIRIYIPSLSDPLELGNQQYLSQVERFLRAVPDIHVAPSSVSAASLVDSLVLANRKIIRPNDVPSFVQFHYLTAVASEVGSFPPSLRSTLYELPNQVLRRRAL
jgi:hypothetical protein